MSWKKNIILIAVIMILPMVFGACGGGGGSDSSSPDVSVVTNPGDGTTGATTVILVGTNGDGKLPINGEYLSPSDYNSSNTAATVTAVDESGNQCTVKVDESGNIIVTPADGTADGTYTVTITTGTREYELIITVTDGVAAVTSAISMPVNSSLVLNLSGGTVALPSGSILKVASASIFSGNYSQDSSIASITVTNEHGTAITVTVDPVTGDLITAGDGSGPYTIIITTSDGSIITIRTDNKGAILGISEQNSTLIINLEGGSGTCGGTTLTLTAQGTDSVWGLAEGVTILGATAADGSITLNTANVWVNRLNGDIMLSGINSSAAPVGPFEIKVSVHGKTYIIQTDAAGTITGILPGNTLLALTDGNITYCGRNIVTFAEQEGGSWTLMSSISDVTATDAQGSGIDVQVNTANGNIVTSDSFTDPVTIVFNYIDNTGNVITYTLVVANGSLISYQAMITEPGPDFDFSTVTQIRVTLKAVDATTGLPIGQVSINMVDENGAYTWKGFTNDDGLSVFDATVAAASETARVVVSHEQYETIDCEITGIGRLIEFGKKISMTPVANTTITDTDGDGVPDDEDDYPADPDAAKKVTAVYTLAFEDLYPSRGDADFNDLVVRLTIVEKIDSQNRLRQINLKTRLLAAGAGYTNKFAININNVQYILISNPKANTVYTLGSLSNTNPGGVYRECQEYEHDPIIFTGGVARSGIAPMPYDPYIICNGVTTNQSHLPFVTTSFTGNVIDSEGFPWAILVPSDWAWPFDGSSIFRGYPEFDDWYLNGGTVSADWYLRPDTNYIYIRQ